MFSEATNEHISVTPLYGGYNDINGVCLRLTFDNVNILLDCGLPSHHILERLSTDPINADVIILSHADIEHLGGLPYLQGKLSRRMTPIPILCTLPVHKFGQMVLYDTYLNQTMEGKILSSITDSTLFYDLDDVDQGFSSTYTVKYCQQVSLERIYQSLGYSIENIPDIFSRIFFCAYPSGRTIGGSMWRIRFGHTDLLYCIDINLRKEIILNGAGLDFLPPSAPALLVTDSGSFRRQHYNNIEQSKAAMNISKKDRDDINKVITSALVTLRDGGNVLIPCEACGRTFEYLQAFARYWYDNKLGLYRLIFLSHMATNIFEYASSQLEWMSESMSKGFYNGKPNPFDLKPLTLLTNIKDLDRNHPGPKVVFATDASLMCGLSKDLLLRWGGDPKNKIIFIDYSHEGSLAADIRNQISSPPIVVTVSRPQRVELVGEELSKHLLEKEKERRLREAIIQRQLLMKELNLLDADREDEADDEMDEPSSNIDETDETRDSAEDGTNQNNLTISRKRRIPKDSLISTLKRSKLPSNQIRRFTEPSFPMFQSHYNIYSMTEYGISNNDMEFRDIAPSYLLQKRSLTTTGTTLSRVGGGQLPYQGAIGNTLPNGLLNKNDIDSSIPDKIISVKSKIQLTCQFYENNPILGRSDVKSIQSLISKVNPANLIVIRGRDVDCNTITSYARVKGILAQSPVNNKTISFKLQADRIKIQIIQSLLPSAMKNLKPMVSQSSSTSNASMPLSNPLNLSNPTHTSEDIRTIYNIQGGIEENHLEIERDGIKVVRYIPITPSEDPRSIMKSSNITGEGIEIDEDGNIIDNPLSSNQDELKDHEGDSDMTDIKDYIDVDSHNFITNITNETQSKSITAISIGEVMLSQLKQLLEQHGINVEFKLGDQGGILVCDSSVTIRKTNDNDFLIEGPPSSIYYTVRKTLYNQLVFL